MAHGETWTLTCDVKQSAQPRQVRDAALRLREYVRQHDQRLNERNTVPVILAPYISLEAAAICSEAGVSYVDFAGNCRLAFGGVFIEREGVPNPNVDKRPLRSIFGPKASNILRVLMREPQRVWKVDELAKAARVSLGQVSNVRRILVDQDLADTDGGLRLTRPGKLLDAWRVAYKPPTGERKRYYSFKQGDALDAAILSVMNNPIPMPHTVLSGHSAAMWIAPFARSSTRSFYCDEGMETILVEGLELTAVEKGENVIIDVIENNDIFTDAIEPAPGRHCTGLVQTYLDLWRSGERGQEAAEHLRKTKIEPAWRGVSG
ncbi:MAG: hypothetical protein EAZ24_11215 [Burkholderiales bacterium]|nr:MAG: hypothetical protein EAZ24_11215 [Burkholderiales bacterium]